MSKVIEKRILEIGATTYNDHALIPGHMFGGIARYIEAGVPTGDFLRCIFSNDLMGAHAHADHLNVQAIATYCYYLYNYAPSNCWGSHEHYLAWINQQGLINKTRGEDDD